MELYQVNDSRVSRRCFVGGVLGFAAFGSRVAFSAAPGTCCGGSPNLVFGVLSDIHVCLAKGGRKLKKNYDTKHLEKAFAYFRDNGADAVVIAGDMAHSGLVGELQAVADAWNRVFPGDKAPDGRSVTRVFVFGNHDWSSPGRAKDVFPDEAERQANYLSADPAKHWEAIFHEPWTPFFVRTVKGYDFVGCHWTNGGCNGKKEVFTRGMSAFYASIEGKLPSDRPFFHIQHPHPRGTVHGEVWGQDDGESVKILSKHPNAIAFSGHSHSSLVDARSVWQGAFTSVGTATLRDANAGVASGLPSGFENGRTPRDRRELDALKVMPEIDRFDLKQAQLVRVYDDRVVIARRDFVADLPLTDDIVIPLPVAEPKPYAVEPRRARAKPPRFPEGAALTIAEVQARRRGAKKKEAAKPSLEITIPPATAEATAVCAQYRVTATGADGQPLVVAVMSPAILHAKSDARVAKPTKCRIALDRLPAGDVKIEVRAVSCWDKTSAALTGTWSRRGAHL